MLFTEYGRSDGREASREFGIETLSASAGGSGCHIAVNLLVSVTYSADGKPTDEMKAKNALLPTQQAEWLPPYSVTAEASPASHIQ